MIKVFHMTIHHFFPELSKWLNQIDDPRVKKTTYIPSHLLWIAILLFLTRLGSKRQIKYLLSTDEFKENLKLIAKSSIHKTPHPDTLENLLKRLKPEEISTIRHKMITRLLRMKCLTSFRLLGIYYMVAVDGTGHVTYKERHCPHCLTKEKDGKVMYYYHNVLEAKIITENGLALSVET